MYIYFHLIQNYSAHRLHTLTIVRNYLMTSFTRHTNVFQDQEASRTISLLVSCDNRLIRHSIIYIVIKYCKFIN